MATWSVMSNVPNPIIVDAAGTAGSGYVLKAFLPGGTVSASIAIDSSGGSPQTSITANAEGKWEVTANEILPFIDRTHKWGIFANATDAAANTPFYMGPFDNVPATGAEIDAGIASNSERVFGTVALMVANTALVSGQFVSFESYTTNGDGGGNRGVVVTASTGTADAGSFIDLPNTTPALQWQALFPGANVDVKQFGAIGDDSTDDSTSLQSAIDHWKTLLSGAAVDDFTEFGATLTFGSSGDIFLHNTSLDFTGIRTKGAIVKFNGSSLSSNCTGKVAVDTTNSRWIQWDNLYIVGDATNTPAVGLLLARNDDVTNNSDSFILNNTRIMGHFSKAGLYNFGSELNNYWNFMCWNYSDSATSYNVVGTRNNELSVVSEYETISTSEESLNDNHFDGLTWLSKLNDGFNVLLNGVRNWRMKGYCNYAGTFPSARKGHCIIQTDSTQRSTDVVFDMHCESPSVVVNGNVAYIHTTTVNTIYGLEVRDFETQALSFVYFENNPQGITNLKLEGFMSGTKRAFTSDAASNPKLREVEIRNLSNIASTTPFAIDLTVLGTGEFQGEVHTFDPVDFVPLTNVTLVTAQILTSVRDISYEGRDVLTIAAGVLTMGSNYIDIKGEGAASDTLNTMAGTFFDGEPITIVNTDAAVVITVTHNAGSDGFFNKSGADVLLSQFGIMRFKYIANLIRWVEI